MRALTLLPLTLVVLAACASAGGGSDGYVDPDYDFAAVRTVNVQTPIRIALRGSTGVGNQQLETQVAAELRTFIRQEAGWSAAARLSEADLVVRFELTDWDQTQTGSRVGGSLELVSPDTDKVVYTVKGVYPSRFGPPAPGSPLDLTDELFRTLFEGVI